MTPYLVIKTGNGSSDFFFDLGFQMVVSYTDGSGNNTNTWQKVKVMQTKGFPVVAALSRQKNKQIPPSMIFLYRWAGKQWSKIKFLSSQVFSVEHQVAECF